MVEAVADFEMFHVAQTVGYNRNPPMQVGQVLKIGLQHNPFFAYYETPPMFSVRTNDGSAHSLNPVHWLENVRLGNVTPDNLPYAAHEIAKHFQTLSRELIMELSRLEHQPAAPSRQFCLWVSDTADLRSHWHGRLDGVKAMVRLIGTGTIHRADAALLTGDAEPMSVTVDKARRYWLGESSEKPEPEILFVGTAEVVEIT